MKFYTIDYDRLNEYLDSTLTERYVRQATREGWLVEVLPCEHENYAPHIDEDEGIWADGDRMHSVQCDGKQKEGT